MLCAETIRKATKDRYETKACVQKPIASLRTRGERSIFLALLKRAAGKVEKGCYKGCYVFGL